MKNILYVMTALEGGAANGTYELLKGLPKSGYRAYLAVSIPPEEAPLVKFKPLCEEIIYIPMSWWNIKRRINICRRLLIWLIVSFRTLFHINTLIKLSRYIKKRRIALVYTTNSQLVDGAIAARICRIAHIWHVKELVSSSLLARLIISLSDRVILISEFVGRRFSSRYGIPQKIKVLREGIDLTPYKTDERNPALRRSLGIEPDEIVLGMVANVKGLNKDHSLFIETARLLKERFPRAKFAVFGKMPGLNAKGILHDNGRGYFLRLKEMVNKAGLSERFVWAGFCRDIPGMMASLDILVHPYPEEGFGRVAIEAMAAGRPVVGPDRGGITESVIDGVTGLLAKTRDAEDFAEKVGRLLIDDSLRNEMGMAGRRGVEKEFSLKRHIEEIAGIYETAISEYKCHCEPERSEGEAISRLLRAKALATFGIASSPCPPAEGEAPRNDVCIRQKPKCRILYVVGQLGPGGLERQLYYLLKAMDRERFSPGVAVWSFSEDDVYVSKIKGLNVPIYSLRGSSAITKLIFLRRIIRIIKPEVVHSFSFYTNFAVFLSAFNLAVTCLGSVKNDFITDKKEEGFLLGRLCSRWPKKQVFNSTAAARNARLPRTIFAPPERFVVKNGLDFEPFKKRPVKIDKRPSILGIGSLTQRKRWDRLLVAAFNLKRQGFDFRVLIAGDGPLRCYLVRERERLKIEDRVEFLGYRDDVSGLLSEAAFLVHTADAEGCPNAVMEAMAAGRAVVATDAGDIPELVDDGRTGFVVRRADDTGLVERIALLINDHALYMKMGQAGRAKAEREFGLARLAGDMLDAYRRAGWKDAK